MHNRLRPKEAFMRNVVPLCLHVYGPITYYECGYTSLPQCALSASGRAAQCVLNPYYASAQEPVGRPYRRHRQVC
jgi:hypothetical protein